MSGRTHKLRTHPDQFWPMVRGEKPFEWRRNDRGYMKGDQLILELWDPAIVTAPIPLAPQVAIMTGDYHRCEGCGQAVSCVVDVVDILHGGRFDIPVGFCIMTTKLKLVHLNRTIDHSEKGLAH